MPNWAQLTPAGTVDRGDTTPGSVTLDIVELSLTWSWGAQPATATMTYTAGFSNPDDSINTSAGYVAPVGAYAELFINSGTSEVHRFYGVVMSDQGLDAAQGKDRVLQFHDLREFLSWDTVFCSFNIPDTVSYADGMTVLKRRRWRHLLPANWQTNQYSYTDAPLTAAEICDYLFGASTVESPWVAQYHPAMVTTPVLGMDFSSGTTLAAALTQVCEPIGMVFTLFGKWILRFRRKGELVTVSNPYTPVDPNMPWASSPFPLDGSGNPVWPRTPGGDHAGDQLRDGLLVTTNPTRVRVIGDRNLYQVLNLELVPDWAAGWQEFWDEQVFLNWVYANVLSDEDVPYAQLPTVNTGDPENIIGWQLASARASELTVGEVAILRESTSSDGASFVDHRLFSGQSRMQMPALLYLRQILWRAYRLPSVILGRAASSFQLVDRQLIGVSHDAAGVIAVEAGQPLDGAGYVIAQGIGFNSQTALRALNPDRFNLADWVDANSRWSVQSFGVDADGGDGIGFIVLDSPVFVAEDAFSAITSGSMNLAVANAAPTIEPAVVRAALTLAGERYVYTWPSTPPSQQKDATQTESGLHAELVYDSSGTLLTSINYADGQAPNDKAQAIASSVLVRQWVYRLGGYDRIIQPGDVGVMLNGVIDRVSISASAQGLTERVDFSAERTGADFIPDRFYERQIRDASLFQGQRELRQQARESNTLASALRANPGFVGTIMRGFHDLIGGGPVSPGKIIPDVAEAEPVSLPAGTPLWRRSTDTTAVLPAEVGTEHNVLLGVTVRDGEYSPNNLPLASNGRVLIRVHGGSAGVAVGDVLGRADGNNYLSPVESEGVAVARASVPASTTRLIWCDIGSGGGGSTGGSDEPIPDTVFWGTGVAGTKITSLAQLRNLGFSEERSDFLRSSGYDIGFNPAGDTHGFFAYPDSFGPIVAMEIPGHVYFPDQPTAGGAEGYGSYEEDGIRYDKLNIGGVPYRIYRTKNLIPTSLILQNPTITEEVIYVGWGIGDPPFSVGPMILEATYGVYRRYTGDPMPGVTYAELSTSPLPETSYRTFPADDLTQFGAPNNTVGTTFVCTSRGSTLTSADQIVALRIANDWTPDGPTTQDAFLSALTIVAYRFYLRAERVATPTFDPVAGDYSTYPASVQVATATAGAELTYKVFTVGDAEEPVTPGVNGWSALAASPVTVSVNEGQEIRAQGRMTGKANSAIGTAQYT